MCYIVPIMPSIYLAALVFSLMGLHNNSARIIVRTIFMENIPNEIMGRVQTIFGVYTRAMVVLSSLYVGWLIETHSIELAVFFTSSHFAFAFLGTLAVIIVWQGNNKILASSKNA